MATEDDTVVYVRASHVVGKKYSKATTSVDSQEHECRDAADELGLSISRVYSDNDLSASKFARSEREDWTELLADIESGGIGTLIMWESSRGSRTFIEWAQFLDVVEKAGVLIHIVEHDTTYDVRKPHDWKILATEGVDSAAESNKIASRIRRGKAAALREGRPSGVTAYGWARIYCPDTGAMQSQKPVPHEIETVKLFFDLFLSGHSLNGSAIEVNRRIDQSRAAPPRTIPYWNTSTVRKILMCPTHAGLLRNHQGEGFVSGNWDGVIGVDDWYWIQGKLNDPRRRRVKPGKSKWLLSRLVRCATCGSYLAVKAAGRPGVRNYGCSRRGDTGQVNHRKRDAPCGSIRVPWLDEYVITETVNRLCSVGTLDRLLEKVDETDEVKEARAQSARLKNELANSWELVKSRRLRMDQYLELADNWEREIAQLDKVGQVRNDDGSQLIKQLYTLVNGSDIAPETVRGAMREAFEDIPISARRELIKTVFEMIVLRPSRARGVSLPAKERVILTPRVV